MWSRVVTRIIVGRFVAAVRAIAWVAAWVSPAGVPPVGVPPARSTPASASAGATAAGIVIRGASSSHSVEVVVYQYDKPFGYGCWMTSITTMNHIFIFLGYSEFPRWLPWQPPGKFRVPQKYKNVVHGCDTSHPTTISKRFIILIYHYLHAVLRERMVRDGRDTRSHVHLVVAEAAVSCMPAEQVHLQFDVAVHERRPWYASANYPLMAATTKYLRRWWLRPTHRAPYTFQYSTSFLTQ